MSLALPAQPPRRLGGPALGGPPATGAPPTTTTSAAQQQQQQQPEFLLDTLAGVEGGPVAMGAEEEASSVEAVASPPPVPPAPAPTKSSHRSSSHHHHHHHHHGYANCFGLPYQDHNYGAPPPATPPQSPPPPPPRSPIRGPSPGGAGRLEAASPLQQPAATGPPPRLNGTLGSPPPGLGSALLEAASGPPLTNGGLPLSSESGHKKGGAAPPLDLQGSAVAAPDDDGAAPAEESVTRCICGFNQDDEYMICCDRCLVWQHVDCMGLDRSRIPETYLCERCCPRRVDRQRARSLQTRKKHQMARLLSRLESAAAAAAAEEDSTAAARHSVTDEKALHGGRKGGATDAESCSPTKRGGSRVVRRKRRRSETSPDAPPAPLRKIQVPTTNPRKTMKEKIERKKVKLKGMVKRSSGSRGAPHGGGGGRRVLSAELPPSAEGEEAAVGDPWRGGSCNWAGPDGDGAVLSYERAPTNQYSPEVQLLASSLQLQEQHEELMREVLRPGWEGCWRLEECPSPKGRGHHHGGGAGGAGGKGGRRLVASRPVSAHQPLLEVRGKFLSAGQFRLQNPVFQKRLYPYVLFYKGLSGSGGGGSPRSLGGRTKGEEGEEWVCVDGRVYGNEARFVRRSCRPSARVLHTVQGGLLRLYLVASRDMAPGQEITIPFDFDYRHCIHRVTCACGQDDCRLNRKGRRASSNTPPERKRRGRRMSSGSGSHGAPAATVAPEVKAEVVVKEEVVVVPSPAAAPVDLSPPQPLPRSSSLVVPSVPAADEEEAEEEEEVTSGATSLDNTKDEHQPAVCTEATMSSNDHQDGSSPQLASPDSGGGHEGMPGNGGDDPDGDPPGPAQGARSRRKMTREERKIDAIMRAFEKMERTEKRRQQALERMAQQHRGGVVMGAQPTTRADGSLLQPDEPTVKLEPEEHSEDGSQGLLPQPVATTPSTTTTTVTEAESSRGGVLEEMDQRSRSATAAHQQQRAASRKGKRRRSTLSRRRTRSNSGGPELLLAAAATVGGLEGVGCPEGVSFPPGLPPSSPGPTAASYEALPSPLGGGGANSAVLSPGCCSPGQQQQQQDSSASAQRSYALPKSKRFLMQGWLHEKAEQQEGAPATPGGGGECPVYVRCTRDGGGISAAHLRRHSCSSSTPNAGGSAKKRWLRQAMFESTEEAPDDSHLVEGASSELPPEDAMLMGGGGGGEDSCHSVSSPPPGGGADLVTPLKKRRLLRESRGSLDSAGGLSPATGEAAATLLSFQTPLLLLASQAQQLQMQMQQQQQQQSLVMVATTPPPISPPTVALPPTMQEHMLLVPQPHTEYPMAEPVADPLVPGVLPPLAPVADEVSSSVGLVACGGGGEGDASPLDDPPTPLDDEGSVDWEDGPPSSPPEVALGPRLLPPLTSGQPSPLELAGRGLPLLEGRPPKAALRLPEPLPGPQPEEEDDQGQQEQPPDEQPPPPPPPCEEEPVTTSFQKPLRQEADSRPARAGDAASNPVPEPTVAEPQPEPRTEPPWGRPDSLDVSDSSSSSSLLSGAVQGPLSPGAARRASSLQKRKVSLSEYRQRMRETARGGTAASSSSSSVPVHPPPSGGSSSMAAPPASSQVPSLAALGLQESLAPIKADLLLPGGAPPPPPPPPPPSARGALDEDESWPQRERLSQRLRREFGLLDDDSDTERGAGHAAASGPESGAAVPPPQPPLMAAPPPMGLPYAHGYLPVPPMQVSPFGPPLTALRPPLLPAALLGGAPPPPPPPHPGIPPPHRPPPGYFHHS